MERVLLTCAETSTHLLTFELTDLFPRLPALHWLAEGVALAEADMGFNAFASECRRLKPMFLRHLAPAQCELALTRDETDIERIADAAFTLKNRLDARRTFAVQTRILGEEPSAYRGFTLNQTLSERLAAETSLTMDVREPGQVVSALIVGKTAWLGVSKTEQNRSAWVGGAQKFRREAEQISRAEFKLLEAIQVFRMRLPAQGWALDLGAAPGGWTRVLRQRGLRVVAVDTAEMDERLRGDAGIVAVRRRVQDYLPTKQKFEVIVNDLRMSPDDSAELMVRAAAHLHDGAQGVMTFKLPDSDDPSLAFRAIESARRLLETKYRVVEARQLYHNRSEVTVALTYSTDGR